MKQFLFILTTLFTLQCLSQDSTAKSAPKWTLGSSTSLLFLNNIKAESGFLHKYKYPKLQPYWGIEIGYILSKRTIISSGLFILYVAYQTDYLWKVQQPSDPAIPITSKNKIAYLDIPLICDFSFIQKGKFEIVSTLGFISSLMINNTSQTTFANNSVKLNKSVTTFIPSLQLGIGFQNNEHNGRLKIEPEYRFFFKGFDSIMYQSPSAFLLKLSFSGEITWKCFFKKNAWRPFPTSCD